MEERVSPAITTGIGIVGAGMVGATTAYSLIMRGLVGEIILVDKNRARAEGEAMDLTHSLPFIGHMSVRAGDISDLAGVDMVIIAAGAAQGPGESRLTLAEANVDVMRRIIPDLEKACPDAMVIIVSNPVDVLTYAAVRLSGFPPQRVIGSGTILDTARFRSELASLCAIDPRNVHAFILGEHGDSEVPVWSLANVAGISLAELIEVCHRSADSGAVEAAFQRARTAAYEIIKRKQATYYAIAAGTARLVETILRDQRSILTVSTLLSGQYGLEDVALSLPCVIGGEGVEEVLEVNLSDIELEGLKKSAGVLASILAKIDWS